MHRVTAPTALPSLSPDWASALVAGPHFVPPYPGAVQDELAWHLVKYLREDAVLQSEVEVEIPAGPDRAPAFFTLDFVVEIPVDGAPGEVRRIAFEAGGGRTVADHERRLRRDATLLAYGVVDTVYRLRGSDLAHRIEDVLFLVSQWDADAFSERGRINLKTLASREARGVALRPEQPSVLVPYAAGDGTGDDAERDLWHVANGLAPHVLVRRLDRRFADVWGAYAEQPLRKVEPVVLRQTG